MRSRRKKIKNSSRLWLYMTAIVFTIVIAISLLIGSPDNKDSAVNIKASSTSQAPNLTSSRYYPPTLKTMIINPSSQTNYFDFILDSGNGNLVNAQELKPEAFNLIKYFFLGLTLPSKEFWVNLNPEQPEKTTSHYLAQTDIGKILLEADLKLKQDAANYTNPRTQLGQAYWAKLHKRLREESLPTSQIPTGTRLWIVPDEIIVEEDDKQVTILSAKLKVCLESEYLQETRNQSTETRKNHINQTIQKINEVVFKEIILPTIEHKVNYGQDYASLRQVYHSLILATCFKQKYSQKANLYSTCINQAHLDGLHSNQPWSKQKFFQAYLASFNQGEYSFYQREYDSYQLDTVNKHYFSGGLNLFIEPQAIEFRWAGSPAVVQNNGIVTVFAPVIEISSGKVRFKAFTENEPLILTDVQVAGSPRLLAESSIDGVSQDTNLAVLNVVEKQAASPSGGIDFTKKLTSSSPLQKVHRLTIPEYRQKLVENLRRVKELYPSLQQAFADGLEVLNSEGIDAFEKKAYPEIKSAAVRIKDKIDIIKGLSATFGLSESELRKKIDQCLQQIAKEIKVDKVSLNFAQTGAYNFYYSFGFSERELINFHSVYHQVFPTIESPEEVQAHDREKYDQAVKLLSELNLASTLEAVPDVKKWEENIDNFISVIIVRTKEYVDKYGQLTEKDRQSLTEKLNSLIDNNQAPWVEVREFLRKNQYYDFDRFLTILRHTSKVDMFGESLLPFIFGVSEGSNIPYCIGRIKANDSESQAWLEILTKQLNNYATENIGTMQNEVFLDVLQRGTDFRKRDIAPYIHARVEAFRNKTEPKGLKFITELSDEELIVWCDLNLLALLIDNLIGNAIKYTETGYIKVSLAKRIMKEEGGKLERECAVLEIEDTGMGIPQGEQGRIFERQYRGSNVKDMVDGTGIGLDIVPIIEGVMPLDVYVQSAIDKGSTFTISLPLAQPTQPEKSSASPIEGELKQKLCSPQDAVKKIRQMIKEFIAQAGDREEVKIQLWFDGYEGGVGKSPFIQTMIEYFKVPEYDILRDIDYDHSGPKKSITPLEMWSFVGTGTAQRTKKAIEASFGLLIQVYLAGKGDFAGEFSDLGIRHADIIIDCREIDYKEGKVLKEMEALWALPWDVENTASTGLPMKEKQIISPAQIVRKVTQELKFKMGPFFTLANAIKLEPETKLSKEMSKRLEELDNYCAEVTKEILRPLWEKLNLKSVIAVHKDEQSILGALINALGHHLNNGIMEIQSISRTSIDTNRLTKENIKIIKESLSRIEKVPAHLAMLSDAEVRLSRSLGQLYIPGVDNIDNFPVRWEDAVSSDSPIVPNKLDSDIGGINLQGMRIKSIEK